MAKIAGFIFRVKQTDTAATFYKALGLSINEHAHGGPLHIEVGPTSPSFVLELYKKSAKFNQDALMIEVDSLDAALLSVREFLGAAPAQVQEHPTMKLVYISDPEGRMIMLYETLSS